MNTTRELEQGRIIKEKYEIVKHLGSGGMGAVYLAKDIENNNSVAIKELHKNSSISDMETIKREAKFLMTLSHPNLPELYDYFCEDGLPYIIMEYIEGRTLEEIIKQTKKPAEEKDVVEWAIQLCELLIYLHTTGSQPIIFRDLKLSNILLDKNNKIRLIDFGIAREFNPQKDTDTIKMGSIGYAPPEQYAKGGQTDERTDIYSLGVCIHSLLTKNDPADCPFAFKDVISINKKITPSLNRIIMKALEIKPENRFQSAMDMLECLKKELPVPLIKITPETVDLGEIPYGEFKKVTLIICNIAKGNLYGHITEELTRGIKANKDSFKGNYNEVIIEINSNNFEISKNYSEQITFASNGGEISVNILFKIIESVPKLEVDVSFIDFGSLKYNGETSEEINIFNTGGGFLEGEISSPQEWMIIEPSSFKDTGKIKISVNQDKLEKEKNIYEGTLIIKSNGGKEEINCILFKPTCNIIPSKLNLGIISEKRKSNTYFKIENTGRGVLTGEIINKASWITLSEYEIKGNSKTIELKIDTKDLKKGILHKSELLIKTNGGNTGIPITIEPVSHLKNFIKIFTILSIIILAYIFYNFHYTVIEKDRHEFCLRLSSIKGSIIYTSKRDKGKIYISNPDGTKKAIISKGFSPVPSIDGTNIVYASETGELKILDFKKVKEKKIKKGFNPAWSYDGKQIVFEQKSGLIEIFNIDTGNIKPLIYGKYPSLSPSGGALIYSDGDNIGSSIKIIYLKDKVPEVIASGFKPSWSPDGHHIVYSVDDKIFSIIHLTNQTKNFLFEGKDPVWSSDGKKILFHSSGIIYIMKTDSWEKKKITEGLSPSWSPDEKYITFIKDSNIYIIELSTLMTCKISSSGEKPEWLKIVF